jgi:hypothetical protein
MTAKKIEWKPDLEFWSASQAEHAFVGPYELVAFDLPEDKSGPREIGWELYIGTDFDVLVATGRAATFEDAKLAAEAAYRAREN